MPFNGSNNPAILVIEKISMDFPDGSRTKGIGWKDILPVQTAIGRLEN